MQAWSFLLFRCQIVPQLRMVASEEVALTVSLNDGSAVPIVDPPAVVV